MSRQRTLKSRINCTGTGLHSNGSVSMTLCPASPDTGILFKRVDLDRVEPIVPARIENVIDSRFSTTIGLDDELRIGTVEHLMATLAGCGIDNAVIEIDGPEVPIMDGSAAPFVFLIECAGTIAQNAPRQAIRILERVRVSDGERSISLSPAAAFSASFQIDYDNPVIAHQEFYFELDEGSFKTELSRARTFCLEREIDHLRSLGLAQGGSLDNAIVVGDSAILNDGGLRHDDEFVRHKILDVIGDMALAGGPIIGHVHGVCSGHEMNHRLVETLMASPESWSLTTLEDESSAAPVEERVAVSA